MPPKHPAKPPAMSGMLDYRSPYDEAWYDVRLFLEGEVVLRVMYSNFSEATDERFPANRFSTAEELDEFRRRFRPSAVQLQDSNCRKVQGTIVCASRSFGPSDVRFYNAVVEEVMAKTHSAVDECQCEFVIRWQEGPLKGQKESTGIENICCLPYIGPVVDPVLERFLKMAKQKLEARATGAGQIPESSRCGLEFTTSVLDFSGGNDAGSSKEQLGSAVDGHLKKPQFPPCKTEEMETPDMKHDSKHTFHVNIIGKRKPGRDIDLGSSKKKYNYPKENHYFIRIENLEEDLSPCCVMDFIREQTSLSCQVSITPPLGSESYSRGFILVETKEKAEKMSAFLLNPAHIIMSSRGRPWVMSERWCGSLEWTMPISKNLSWNHNEHGYKIKAVHIGSIEYDKSVEQLKIHKEFHDHLHLLHKRLARDEKALMLRLDADFEEKCKILPPQ